jgi:hypothetical protein
MNTGDSKEMPKLRYALFAIEKLNESGAGAGQSGVIRMSARELLNSLAKLKPFNDLKSFGVIFPAVISNHVCILTSNEQDVDRLSFKTIPVNEKLHLVKQPPSEINSQSTV